MNPLPAFLMFASITARLISQLVFPDSPQLKATFELN